MTVVPVNVEALKKAEKEESQARWKTEKGWIFPGMKSTLECNEHPQRPNTARIEELQEVREGENNCNNELIWVFYQLYLHPMASSKSCGLSILWLFWNICLD